MKFKAAFFVHFAIILLLIYSSIPVSRANAQGQIRALRERADTVSKRKNRFVTKVLNQYGINYRVDRYGIVTLINLTGDWRKVMRIDVIPMVKRGTKLDEVVGHEILIYTDRETVHLVSHLKVR